MKDNKNQEAVNAEKLKNQQQKVAESDYDLKVTAAGKEQKLKSPADSNHTQPHNHNGTRGK